MCSGSSTGLPIGLNTQLRVCMCVCFGGASSDVNKMCSEKFMQNRKTTDNALKAGQYNEMFIALKRPEHDKRECERGINSK